MADPTVVAAPQAPVAKPNVTPVPQAPVETPKIAEAPKPAEPKVTAPTVTSADILKRTNAQAPTETPKSTEETNYREDLEKITDPSVRAIAEKALKDFESGYNKKFQTLAQQRKELESMQQKISTWTPERLQSELKNPAFVQAMQILQQQAPPSTFEGTVDEWSSMSPQEKQRMQTLEQEQRSLQSQLASMKQKEEDVQIKQLYPDYEPQIVDEAIEGLRNGQIQASRVDIWKVVNHDKNVEKGYQFGYEDGYNKALSKLNGNSILPGNGSVTPADQVPEEVRKGGFSSIAMWRLSKAKGGQSKR